MLKHLKLRRVVWPLVSVVTVIGAIWLTLLSPPILTLLLRRSLSGALGTPVEVTNARWDGWGHVSVEAVRVTAEGWPGRAGEIAEIRDLRSDFRPLDLLLGVIALKDIEVAEATIRIARREPSDELNLLAIRPPQGRSWLNFSILPERARLEHLKIENLVVEDDRITTLADPSFRGGLAGDPARGPHELRFEFIEIEGADLQTQPVPRDTADGLRLEGRWNDRTLAYELNANKLDFDRTIRPLLPRAVQEYCSKRLALKGMVSDVKLVGSPERPLSEAQVLVRGVALNLDDLALGLGIEWERFSEGVRSPLQGTPRMNVATGRIVLANDQLRLEGFEGTLFSIDTTPPGQPPTARSVPLPMRMSLALDFARLPPLSNMADIDAAEAWAEAAFRHCGVKATFEVPDYALLRRSPETPWAVELPEAVVNVLDNFKVMQGNLRIEARADRPPTQPGTPASPPKVSGSLAIQNGSGAYVNFRYPMRDVEADIEFEDETIKVHSLRAVGATGNGMLIKGTVDGADDDAGVDLRVQTTGPAPIDLDLQNAFDEGPRRIFELLFARDMRDRLVEAELMTADGTELGGKCEFDITVRRKRGGGSRVETTGSIRVWDANVLCSRFPYPIYVEKGSITLEDEAIILPAQTWRFRTSGMGTGTISGRVSIPRAPEGGRLARPDLELVVTEDQVRPLLLAAIPLEDWENGRSRNQRWPGRERSVAAECMIALGLSGEVNVGGHIGCTSTGETTLDINILLENGAFRPRNGSDQRLERLGLPWPEHFDLDGVLAKVHLTEQVATLVSLSGRAGSGSVQARGAASLHRVDRILEAQLTAAPLGLWMVPLLPQDVRRSAADAWERCDVQGSFDGSIMIRQRGEGNDERRASFTTAGVTLRARDVPSELRVVSGSLDIDGPNLILSKVSVDAICRDDCIGSFEADGSIALDPTGRQDLSGLWSVAESASVLWPELLRAANLDRIAELHDDWNPVGSAAGSLRVLRDASGQPDWDIEVTRGGMLIGDPGGVPIALSLVPGGHLSFGPDSIGLRGPDQGIPGLIGMAPGGEFLLEGTLSTGPRGPADGGRMRLGFDIGPVNDSILRVLPQDLSDALQTIDLRAGNAHSRTLHLLGWTPTAREIGLLGNIVLDDASMDAGTTLTRIHANFAIDARGGRPYPVQIGLGEGEGTFMTRERFFERSRGLLRLTDEARRIEIIDLQADLYGGRACASARIGGESRDWNLDVRVDGASLPGLIRGGANTSFAASGSVRGSLSLGGDLDATGSLRGVGHLEATDARMGELPLTLRVLQATQLMLPLSDSLERASLDFFLRGDALRFERFDLSCPTLRLMGVGSMNLESWDVSLRFRNRGVLPGISDLFGAASDALFVIDVTGPAGDPKVQLTPLPPLGQDPSSPQPPPRLAADTRKEP